MIPKRSRASTCSPSTTNANSMPSGGWHQEMIGAGSGGPTHLQQMKPEPVGEDRAAEHEEGERADQTRRVVDRVDIGEGERDRRQHDAGGKVLDAVADPQRPLRREQLEQDGAGDDRSQRGQREEDAVQRVRADRETVPDNRRHADHAKHEAARLAPGHALAEEKRGERGREHRVRRDDQATKTGGNRLQAGVAEPEIERVVGDAEHCEDRSVAPGQGPIIAPYQRGAQDQNACEREAGGEQDQRRAMGDADLAGDEGVAPEQAEQTDSERQRVETAARNRNRGSERHAAFS